MEITALQIKKILEKEAQVREETLDEVIENFIGIGFCQPKFYKPSVWAKVKKVMLFLTSMNIGVIHRPCRGGGHFWTNDEVFNNMRFSEEIAFLKNELKDKLYA